MTTFPKRSANLSVVRQGTASEHVDCWPTEWNEIVIPLFELLEAYLEHEKQPTQVQRSFVLIATSVITAAAIGTMIYWIS